MIKEIIERNREEVDEIKKIYNDFYESAKEDAEGRRLFKSLYQKANDYIECKRRWECLSDIEACKINGERSELHEIFIQAFQEMLEYTEKQGKKHSKNTFDWNRNNIAAFADELVSRKHESAEDQFYQSCLKQMQENDCRHVYDKKLRACNVGCMLPYMNYTPRTLEEILEGVEVETK